MKCLSWGRLLSDMFSPTWILACSSLETGVGRSTDTAGLGTCATKAVVALRSELHLRGLRCLMLWRRRLRLLRRHSCRRWGAIQCACVRESEAEVIFHSFLSSICRRNCFDHGRTG